MEKNLETKEDFKRKFINREEIPVHYNCKICQEILKNPMRVKCGHSFCKLCCKSQNLTICPICGVNSVFKNPVKNFTLEKLIEEFEVECPKDCGKVGKLCDIKNHFRICGGKNKEADPLKESLKRTNVLDNTEILKETKRGKPNEVGDSEGVLFSENVVA